MMHFFVEEKVFKSSYSWVFGDYDLSTFASVNQIRTLQRYPSISKWVMFSFMHTNITSESSKTSVKPSVFAKESLF